MATFGDARGYHETCRLHTYRTLGYLVGSERCRLSVDHFNYIFPLHEGAWIVQVLSIAILLLSDDLSALFSLLRRLLCRVGGLGDLFSQCNLLTFQLSDWLDDILEGCLFYLLLAKSSMVVRVASIPSPLPG